MFPIELLVIRHGQSEADLLKVHEGRADFSLTEEGMRQARKMAAWVHARFAPARICASPLRRAAQTAQALHDATGAPIVFLDGLMEHNNGLLAGLPFEEARAKFPRPAIQRPHEAPYETESRIAFRARVETVLCGLLYDGDPDETIAIVAHGGTINHLYASFLRLPVDAPVAFATGDTCVHHWRVKDERRVVVFANSLCHLEKGCE